jgi:four helix bundle protein
LAEADYGISKKEFLAKVFIALKECSETIYWIELLFETNYINKNEFESINKDDLELLKMLTATSKTTNKNLLTNPPK